MLIAANVAFLAAGAVLFGLAHRHLLRGAAPARRLELAACILVSLLAVAGFWLAHVGMNASWTGRRETTSLSWLVAAGIFSAALLSAHALLRLFRTRADQLVLPIAAFLGLLSLLNVYVWEARDANAYVSTTALPALREYRSRVVQDRSLAPGTKASLLETLGAVPNELDFERLPGRTATVLDPHWLAAYNAAADRYDAARAIDGARGTNLVRHVRLGDLLRTQLLAVAMGVLLVPLVLLVWSRAAPAVAKARSGQLLAIGVLGLVAVAVAMSGTSGLPPLLRLGGHTVTVYELVKVGVVVLLAWGLSLRAPTRERRLAYAAVAVTIAVLIWRDPGAGLTLLAIAAFMSTLVARRVRGAVVVVAGVVAVAAAPAAARLIGGELPGTIGVRFQMWTDPWGAFQQAEVENDVARTLERVVSYRLRSVDGARHTAAVGQPTTPAAESVARDANDIERELRWRQAALGLGKQTASPFLPEDDPVAPLVLLEAEKLWSDLGGFRATADGGDAAALRGRVEAAIDELHADADELAASVLDGRPARAGVAPDNFQLQRGLYALDKGGVVGVGLGHGKPEAVPGLTEDLALAAIGESLGIAGVLLVALLVLLLTTRGIALGRGQKNRFHALLAIGLSALLGLQAVISLGGLTGVVPFTGLTFPFVSRSGTAIMSGFLLVALLMVISDRSEPRAPTSTTTGRLSRVLGSGGFPLAFALVLANVVLLQLTGRTLAPGPLLAGLPGPGAAFLHASDQWDGPGYRRVRGSITDRRDRVLARTTSPGSERIFPDPLTATSFGHTLLQLDLSFGDRLLDEQPGSRSVGPTLVATIDSAVQRAVDAAFDDGTREAGLQDVRALRGAVAVVDVRDGGIVALLSRPGFGLDELSDAEAWARAEARERRSGFAYRYLHRAVYGLYPPGSIFKTVTAAGILERGFHTLHSQDFDYDHGPTGRRAPDRIDQLGPWHQLPLGDGPPITDGNHPQLDRWLFDLEDAFIWSCNVAFAEMGLELGAADLVNIAHRFGFERELRVPGLGATTSTLDGDSGKPIDQRYLSRSASNLARTGFGQGRARVTPLQMALVPAAIANGGTIMQPRIVAGWKSTDGRWLERYQPSVFADTALSRQTIADLRRMMWDSVTRGWARTARVNPNNVGPGVAGKTGSAEWTEVADASHAWFIGFFPAEAPRLALSVIVERGGAGPTVAGRIARRIFAADAIQRYVEEAAER